MDVVIIEDDTTADTDFTSRMNDFYPRMASRWGLIILE